MSTKHTRGWLPVMNVLRARTRKLLAAFLCGWMLYFILIREDLYKNVSSTQYAVRDKQDMVNMDRRERMKHYCRNLLKRNTIDYERMWLVDENYKTLFCSLPKVGSTFWNHVFHILRYGNESFASPFSVNTAFYHHLEYALNQSTNASSLLNLIKNNYLKVVFVREPYSRLFSAYVDKLVQPHGYYWNVTGRYVAQRTSGTNKTKNKLNMACGHNISFSDVVKYVIHAESTVHHRDIHFAPMYQQCNICQLHYDIIGKMETFRKDAVFFLNNIHAMNAGIDMNNWTKDRDNNYIIEKCAFTFKIRNNIRHCMSFHELLQRQWRAFQIAGIISKKLIFPFTEGSADGLTLNEYIQVIVSAHTRSRSSAKANKHEAFIQAYSSLSRGVLVSLKDTLLLDFQLFGYNPEPDDIFKPQIQNRTFNYFDFLKQ